MTAHTTAPTSRGLSTAGSLLVIFVGVSMSLGGMYTATANTGERVASAVERTQETSTAIAETELSIERVVWNTSWNESRTNLTVEVANTGDRSIRLSELDTLVDGAYLSTDAYERVEADGRDADRWRPGERLILRDEETIDRRGGSPVRVTIVADVGVAATAEVRHR